MVERHDQTYVRYDAEDRIAITLGGGDRDTCGLKNTHRNADARARAARFIR